MVGLRASMRSIVASSARPTKDRCAGSEPRAPSPSACANSSARMPCRRLLAVRVPTPKRSSQRPRVAVNGAPTATSPTPSDEPSARSVSSSGRRSPGRSGGSASSARPSGALAVHAFWPPSAPSAPASGLDAPELGPEGPSSPGAKRAGDRPLALMPPSATTCYRAPSPRSTTRPPISRSLRPSRRTAGLGPTPPSWPVEGDVGALAAVLDRHGPPHRYEALARGF